jgi:zinc protease
MFQGSVHVAPEQHVKLLEEAGASAVNAATDFGSTEYTQTVPRGDLELALWLEADRMGWLLESLTEDKLEKVRAVVKNERRQKVETVPWGLAREKLWQAVFPSEHALHGMVIGAEADLDRVSLDDVRAFLDEFYIPSNATLVVTGDIEPAAAKQAVRKYFGSLPTWTKPSLPSVTMPALSGELLVEHQETVGTLAWVELLWLVPGRGQQGELELQVLARTLGDGLGSKLQEALLVQTQQAEVVTVTMDASSGVGVFSIGVAVRPDVKPTDVVEAVMAQLNFLQEIPIGPEEVARAKKRIENEVLFSLQDGSTRAALFQASHHVDGNPTASAQRVAALQAITDDAVMAALARWLTKDGRAVLVASPHTGAAPSTTAATESP